MNKKTLINNNEILIKAINSIRGVTPINGYSTLNEANLKLFQQELKNNKDVIARNDIEIKDVKDMLHSTINDKELLNNRLSAVKTELTLTKDKLEEMDEVLEEMKAKVKHSYIEAEVKHKVKLFKEEVEFYKDRYLAIDEEYSKLLKAINEIALKRGSEDIKEIAIEFAKHTSPKIIIPDIEQKEI